MTQTQRTLIVRHGGAIMALALALAFAACGSTANAAGANTSSTAACATATARAKNGAQGQTPQTISGKITTINGNVLTVTSTAGKTTTVNLTGNTRISKIAPIQASSLTSGTTVIILTNPSTGSSPTTARSIIVQPAGGQNGTPTPGGFPGGFGGGRPGRNGGNFTPCRAGTGTGARPGGLGGARGIRGTITAYNASTQQLTITDAQGTTYLIGVTSTTIIGSFSAGAASDLAVGETITVSGMTSGKSVNARTIQILSGATTQ